MNSLMINQEKKNGIDKEKNYLSYDGFTAEEIRRHYEIIAFGNNLSEIEEKSKKCFNNSRQN